MIHEEHHITNDFLIELRKLVKDYYFETSKILIATEQLSEKSPIPFLTYLRGMFDNIFLNSKVKQGKNEIGKLKIVFVGLQAFYLYFSIKNIINKYEKIDDLRHIQIDLDRKLEAIDFSFDDQWSLFDINQEREQIIVNAKTILLDTYKQVLSIFKITFDLENDGWGYNIDFNKSPIGDDGYSNAFLEVMDNYRIARYILYDIFRKKGTYYECAVADLRDAFDHIAKSLFMNDEDAIEELTCAREHVRRSSVETLQNYVVDKFNQKKGLFTSENDKLISDILKIKMTISYARYSKSNRTWFKSVMSFYNALEDIQKLGENNA